MKSIHIISKLFDLVDNLDLEKHVAIGADAIVTSAGARLRIVRPEFVCGDLLFRKTIVGLVVIEGLDYVIAIAPGFERVRVLFETGSIGITHQIEPMPAPFFSVARRDKQRIDKLLPGVWRLIAQKRAHLFGRGWKSMQIETGSADEGEAVGFRCGLDAG
jgi:hypothetical protein